MSDHFCPRCKSEVPCTAPQAEAFIAEPFVVIETRGGAPHRAITAPDEGSAMEIAKTIVQSLDFAASYENGVSGDCVSVFDLSEQPAHDLVDLDMLEDWIAEYDILLEDDAKLMSSELERAGISDFEEDTTHDYHPGMTVREKPVGRGLRVISENEVFGTPEKETSVGEDIVRKNESEEEDRTVRIVRVEGESEAEGGQDD